MSSFDFSDESYLKRSRGRWFVAVLLAVGMDTGCEKPHVTEMPSYHMQSEGIRASMRYPAGQNEQTWRQTGLKKAEGFRRRLVESGHDHILAKAIYRFHQSVQSNQLLAGRPDLALFDGLTTQAVLEGIRGSPRGIDGTSAFGEFTGQWYGVWGQVKVDHCWDDVNLRPEPLGGATLPRPLAMQWSWLGNGFCWHIVAGLPDPAGGRAILGIVTRVAGQTPGQTVPHVGVAGPKKGLIWINPSHVFFEYVTSDERYVIVGFGYTIKSGTLSFQGSRGLQAIYTRSPGNRPAFHAFDLFPVDRGEHTP